MPHNFVKCYGFYIPTNTSYDPPLSPDPEEEIAIRIRALVKAIDIIEKKQRNSDDWSNTLKILVAPEFFFRPLGNGDAYQYPEQFNFAVEQIFNGFGSSTMKDWLIIAGTIISKQASQNSNKLVGYNTAILVKGGQQKWGLVEKQFVSTIDGMDQYIHGKVETALGNVEIEQYMQDTQPIVFDEDGLKFGVEICLDHIMGVLSKSGKQAHIQMITSCGLINNKGEPNIVPANIVAPLVFRVDGMEGQTSPVTMYKLSQGSWQTVNGSLIDYSTNIDQAHLIARLNAQGKQVYLYEFPKVNINELN